MEPKLLPTQKRLKQVLSYDPVTGAFERLGRGPGPAKKSYSDTQPGHVSKRGYRLISVDGIAYYAARLAYVWMTGECPDRVGPIDGNPANTAWNNLAPTNPSISGRRWGYRKPNKFGLVGVYKKTNENRYYVRIRVAGKLKHLGGYDSPEAAAEAYARAATEAFVKGSGKEG